ncbi:MAG: hypothetical protein ACYTHM_19470 [Planctomycetota bacterium]|jgi:hypothetical protein
MRSGPQATALRQAEEEIRSQAETAVRSRERQAATAAEKGKWEEAIRILKGVEAYGMPGLFEKLKPLIETYESEMRTASFRELHLRVLDRIAAAGLARGRDLLGEELDKGPGPQISAMIRKDVENISKAEGVWRAVTQGAASASGMLTVRLETGEVLRGEIKGEGENFRVKGPEGERVLKASDLASPSVRALAKTQPLPTACFAWYVNRDLPYLLELTGGKTKGKDELHELVRLAVACTRADFQSSLEAITAGSADASRMLPILQKWGGLPFFTAQEDQLRILSARFFRGLANPFLFGRDPGRTPEKGVTLHYDFRTPFAFDRFLCPGRGRWKAGWGTLEQEAVQAGQIEAFLPGVWKTFRVEMDVLMASAVRGVGFTFHRQPNGDRYAFQVHQRRDGLRVGFYFRQPNSPALFLMGTPATIENPDLDRFHNMSLSVAEGIFTGQFAGTKLNLSAADRKAFEKDGHAELPSGRLGIRASSPVTVRRLAVEGTPVPVWVSDLFDARLLEPLPRDGEARLFDGISTKGWEILMGRARVQQKSLVLEPPLSAVSHTSGTVFDGRKNMRVRFQARRKGDQGFLLIGYRFGRTPRIMAIRPRKDEPLPGVLPPGIRVVDAPAGDGKWHTFVLLEGPEGAALWMDRQKQFLEDTGKETAESFHRFHLWGLGFGTAGGEWEIREIVATRKTF